MPETIEIPVSVQYDAGRLNDLMREWARGDMTPNQFRERMPAVSLAIQNASFPVSIRPVFFVSFDESEHDDETEPCSS